MININDKLIQAINNKEPTNCIGTALFLVGEISKERIVWDYNEFDQYLSGLEILKEPKRGCLISWENENNKFRDCVHMGVVTSINPLLVTCRTGIYWEGKGNYPIIQDYSADLIDEDIGPGLIKKYYKPQQEISFN